MKKIFFFLLLSQSILTKGFSQYDISGIAINTIENKTFNWGSFAGKLRVIVFLAPECPLSQQSTLPLKKLQEKYGNLLSIVGVFAGTDYEDAAYQNFKEKYQISFDLLKDEDFKLVKLLKATITPQLFLLDNGGQLLYNGAIDNKVVRLGFTRNSATKHYVEDAISSYTNHLPIALKETKAIGCLIEIQ